MWTGQARVGPRGEEKGNNWVEWMRRKGKK